MTVSLLLHCVLLSLLVSTQIYLEERRRKEEARKIEKKKKKKRGRDAEEQSATLPSTTMPLQAPCSSMPVLIALPPSRLGQALRKGAFVRCTMVASSTVRFLKNTQ